MNHPQTHQYLPVVEILIGALVLPWVRRSEFLLALYPTAAVLLVFQLIWHFVARIDPHPVWYQPVAWLYSLIYLIVVTKFAVVCHRTVLLGYDSVKDARTPLDWSKRESGFLIRVFTVYVAIGLGALVVILLPGTLLINLFVQEESLGANTIFEVLVYALMIPASYALARLSLLFPAAPLDKQEKFQWAFSLSKGNGWRLVVVVGVLPWAMGWINSLVGSKTPSLIEAALFIVVNLLMLTIEITALSLSYRKLADEDFSQS